MVLLLIMIRSMKHPLKHDVAWITFFVFLDCIMDFEILAVFALDSSVLIIEPVVV